MYTTIVPRKFKEKVYNRKQSIKFRLSTDEKKICNSKGQPQLNNSKKGSRKNG